MGHRFTRSHWSIQTADGWSDEREAPCFMSVRNYIEAPSAPKRTEWRATAIRTRLEPSIITEKENPDVFIPLCGDISCRTCPLRPYRDIVSYPINITEDQCDQFVRDVMDACPGVVERIDKWKFHYPLTNWTEYWKFLGVASLLRCVEEWWLYIEEYFELRSKGIPRDVALIAMWVGGRDPRPYCGHALIGSLSNLNHLKNFSLKNGFLSNCANLSRLDVSLWSLVQCKPWFDAVSRYPSAFKMTPEIYNAFCDDKLSISDRCAIIRNHNPNADFPRGYEALAA